MMFCGLILLFGAIFSVQARFDYYNQVRTATESGTLKQLNTNITTPKLMVFENMMFLEPGKLAQWDFFAHEKGWFYLMVFRPNVHRTKLTLVGKNYVKAEGTGETEIEIPLLERITVNTQDMVGIGYDSDKSAGIISLETNPSSGLHLGKMFEASIYGSDFSQGLVIPFTSFTSSRSGVPSIKATVHGVTTNIRLTGGPTAYEGLVELKLGDTWGTCCDKWFQLGGWPRLCCFEMGYPNVKFAKTVTEMGLDPVNNSEKQIHVMNPHCKASDNGTMLNCPVHEKATCTHDEDVYVACMPRYKMVQAPKHPGWNITYKYEDGYWGEICDDREPSWHIDHRTSSWLTGFCNELGYSGFKNVMRVENPYTIGRTFMENPDCGLAVNPTQMAMCPSGPLKTPCDNKIYYMQCGELKKQ